MDEISSLRFKAAMNSLVQRGNVDMQVT